jgi:hypothetical protein
MFYNVLDKGYGRCKVKCPECESFNCDRYTPLKVVKRDVISLTFECSKCFCRFEVSKHEKNKQKALFEELNSINEALSLCEKIRREYLLL